MRKLLSLATALVLCTSLAGCGADGSGGPTTPQTPAVRNLPPVDEGGGDYGGGGGGGGDTGGTVTPPPAPQYRLSAQVYPIASERCGYNCSRVEMRGWSRFEQNIGGQWVKVDASSIGLQCYGAGVSDSDQESNAGFTDVQFWIGPAPVGYNYLVQCSHTATYGGVTYTTSSSYYVTMV